MNRPANQDLRFEYIQALCQAIETFTGNAEAQDPNAFKYRGVNLKFAVERFLYFSFVDDEQLYDLFCQDQQGNPPEIVKFNQKLEKELALYLCGESVAQNRLEVRQKISFLAPLRHLKKWAKSWARFLLRQLNPTTELEPVQATVLIWIDHPKFVRYMRPITDALPVSYAYLLLRKPERREIKPFLVEQEMPFVDLAELNVSSKGKAPKGALASFRSFVTLCDRVIASLKQLNPQCLVVVEGNHPPDEVINQVGKQLSIPTVCLQQGWSPIVHNGFRNMSYTKMLVWGEGFAELLQPYNPNQRFVATGSHIVNTERFAGELSEALPRRGISFFLQSPRKLGSQSSWEELLKLINYTAIEFREVPILVREHPSYPLPEQERNDVLNAENVQLVPPGSYSLAEILNASCLAVTIFSTTILESIAAGVFPLVFNVTSMPSYYPDVAATGAAVEVKSIDEAMPVIRSVLTDVEYCQKVQTAATQFKAKYFYQDSQKPVEHIVKEITELCDRQAKSKLAN